MKLTDERIEELRAKQLPRLDWRDLFDVTEGQVTIEDAAAMSAYFSRFVMSPEGKGGCINCELVQGGLISALLGGFRWGLAHGEGSCSRCGYPARAIHYEVGIIRRLEAIFQYHPDELRTRAEREASELEKPSVVTNGDEK